MYVIRSEFDDTQWESRDGESLDSFISRTIKDYKFSLSDFDVFQVWEDDAIIGHTNKAGDFFPCSCSVMDVTRGGCKCGSLVECEEKSL